MSEDNIKYWAHVRGSDNAIQSVSIHLLEVGELASQFAAKLGIPLAGLLIGLMHDFGKYSMMFQNYLKSATGQIDCDEDDYIDARKK